MFKKLNTKTLIILLIVLGAIVAYTSYNDSKKGDSTFRTEFVSIDTSAVTTILLFPKSENGKEIKFSKSGSKWELQNDKVKTFADTAAVKGLLGGFALLKAQSLAGAGKDKWNELQVGDTTATRIKFITSDNKTYDIMVGKFGYDNETRSGTTCVRLHDEEETYTVEGFLSFSVNQGFNSWRNRSLTKGGQENWTKLSFTYPADSSFILEKQNNMWLLNGRPCDSSLAANYINSIANLNSDKFLDNYTPAVSFPVYTLTIEGNNQSSIVIKALPADSAILLALNSSLNPDAYFSEADSKIAEKAFVGKSKFFAVTEEK